MQSLYIAAVFLSSNASTTSIPFDHANDIHVGFENKNAGAGVDDGNDQGKQCFGKNAPKHFARCVIANLRQKHCLHAFANS